MDEDTLGDCGILENNSVRVVFLDQWAQEYYLECSASNFSSKELNKLNSLYNIINIISLSNLILLLLTKA